MMLLLKVERQAKCHIRSDKQRNSCNDHGNVWIRITIVELETSH